MDKPRGSFIKAMSILGDIKKAVEIGVREGSNAVAMLGYSLDFHSIDFLYLVDCYPEYTEYWLESGLTVITGAMQDAFKANMLDAIRPYGERVAYLDKTSIEAAKSFSDDSLDYVYIDADHTYAGVMSDIQAWYPKVRRGGIISGHDYMKDGYPGVVEAVNGFALKMKLDLVPCKDSDWMIIKP